MANSVTIRNKTAHVKQLHGGGQIIAIPPTPEGTPGVTVTFDSDEEQKRFQQALDSSVVKRWIERKELEVESGTTEGASPASKQAAPPPPPPPAQPPAQPPPAPSPAEPAPSRHFGRRGDRE